jgi:hypothetical protein
LKAGGSEKKVEILKTLNEDTLEALQEIEEGIAEK